MRFLYIGMLGLLLLGCTSDPAPITEIPIATGSPTGTASPSAPTTATIELPTDTPVPAPEVVLVGAGDIASCSREGDEATAALLDMIPGTVFTTGDNVYPDGSMEEFLDCYEPTWGRHKERTYPSLGNHDYGTGSAASYFEYFGPAAGDPGKGYYSYDLGSWHIIVLNSEIDVSAGSEQEQWLRADLAAHQVACTLAYWHEPRFSSGDLHGSSVRVQPIWQALYDYGADVVLNGHEHNYERFAPQDPQGNPDPVHGIRQFVVGTGGRNHYAISNPLPNSEVHNTDTFGVLKLVLQADSYRWEFVPEQGKSFTDSGTTPCVTADALAAGDTLTFLPSADATVESDSPEANFGTGNRLQIDTGPDHNFLIKFDVVGTNNRSVVEARLRLHTVNESNAGGDFYFVEDNSWDEGSVTWATAPGGTSTLIASLGPVNKDTWYEIDLTSFVTGDGTYTFRVSTASTNGADYASKESEAGLAPQLVVRLSDATEP